MGPPNPRFIIEGSDFFDRTSRGEEIDLELNELITKRELSGEYRLEASGQPTEKFSEGDLMVFSMGGGGGYGDVLERDPNLVRKDLLDKMITKDIAEKIYGVLFVSESLEIDSDKTEKRRNRMRRTRLRKGKSFDDFIEGWLEKRPRDDIIQYYGDWPEPRVPEYNKRFWGQLV